MPEEFTCEQLRDLKETHIPPLKKEWQELKRFYETRRPPERRKADFYSKLLKSLNELEKQIEKDLKICEVS
jgi:hypothetical protein